MGLFSGGGFTGIGINSPSSVGGFLNDITGATSAAKQSQKYALQSAAINHKYQKEFAQNAHQWEVEDLQKAGLNPVLSAGGSGASASGGGVSSASAQASGINPVDSIINTVNGIQSAKKIGAETANIQAQTLNAQTDTIAKGIVNKITEIELAYKDKKSNAELDNLRQELRNLQAQYDKIVEETKQIKGGSGSKILGTEPGKIVKDIADAVKEQGKKQGAKDVVNSNAYMGYPGLF